MGGVWDETRCIMGRAALHRICCYTSMVWLLLQPHALQAQIYHLEEVPVPANKSLHTLYAYYIFAHTDPAAPAPASGSAFVKFSGFNSHASLPPGKNKDPTHYEGIQLSLVKYDSFWKLINPTKFCCTEEDVKAKVCKAKDKLLVTRPAKGDKDAGEQEYFSHTAMFPMLPESSHDQQFQITTTGAYILVFSNCGNFARAVVSGSIVVKNPYGFLPGNEYHRMAFYGWLSLIYTCLALLWLALSLRWFKELFNIQSCIGVVIFFGLVEAFLWYVFFTDWNDSGVRGKFLFILATMATVLKSTFSYMLVLVAAMGWGVTKPYLNRDVIKKIQALCFLYIVLDFVRESVLSFRTSHTISIALTFVCSVPVTVLNGIIFYWVFTALTDLIETLKDRRQNQKLMLFQRLWRILIFVLIVAVLTVFLQVVSVSQSLAESWKWQWVLNDGVTHILFLLVLVVMMYLWAPHKYSQRYAYSHQCDDGDAEDQDVLAKVAEEESRAIWGDGLDDEGDIDSFWDTTQHNGSSSAAATSSRAAGQTTTDRRPASSSASSSAPSASVVGAAASSSQDVEGLML